MITVTIYSGSHYSCEPLKVYKAIGHIDHVSAGARAKCGQLAPNKRLWVSFEDESGAPISHRIYQEG